MEKILKKYETTYWELCSTKQEGDGSGNGLPSLPVFWARSWIVMNASKMVVQAWMCLSFSRGTGVFKEIILHLARRICLTMKFLARVESICIPGLECLYISGATVKEKIVCNVCIYRVCYSCTQVSVMSTAFTVCICHCAKHRDFKLFCDTNFVQTKHSN